MPHLYLIYTQEIFLSKNVFFFENIFIYESKFSIDNISKTAYATPYLSFLDDIIVSPSENSLHMH